MSKRPEPRPEGQLITEALKRSRLSAREAASRVPISEARWRQIVSGYQTVSGQQIPVRGPAETLARMARVVGLTSTDLEGVRDDAADIMRSEQERGPAEGTGPPDRVKLAQEYMREAEELIRQAQQILGETPQTNEPRRTAG